MTMKDSIKLFLLKNPLISDTRIKQQHIKWTSNDTQQLNVYILIHTLLDINMKFCWTHKTKNYSNFKRVSSSTCHPINWF